jgi:hypothetical protein
MKKALKISLGVLLLTFLVSTAFAKEDIPRSGFLGGPTLYKQLKPGEEGGAKLRWLNPKVDFKKYNKLMIDSVIFFLADKAQYKGIDPQEMKELADEFNKQILAAVKDKWPVVSEPGPGVVRLKIAITNIEPSKPGAAAVTSVVPVGLGVSLVKKGATGGWTGSGQTGVEVAWIDTETNEVIAMAVDQRKAEFEQRFSKWGSATDAFKFWAERIAYALDKFFPGIDKAPKK